MARQLRMGNTLTCPGMNGFSSLGAIRERANDSYLLFPSMVRHFRPPCVHSSMIELMGASLQTLQHHLKSFAGGPKLERFSQKASPASTAISSILFSLQNRLMNFTVSGNSMPVFAKNTFTVFQSGTTKDVVKEAAVFRFSFSDGAIVEIDGRLLVGRPEDRLKKSVKRLW